jgi:hypothetical protein
VVLRLQTPKHIKGGWSHYSDISGPVVGYVANNMVNVQSVYKSGGEEEKVLI